MLSFNEDEELDVYFFTKKGLVKRTMLSEFKGNYFTTLGYKFKNDKDELIAVDFSKQDREDDIVIITSRGMCIRFDKSSVNPMGKIASGVTGISLKEDDEVVCAFINRQEYKSIVVKSKKENEENISLENIKVQNRAGRGNNIILVVMEDEVNTVHIES